MSAARFPWRSASWLFLALVLDDKLAPHLAGSPFLLPELTRIAVLWVALTHDVRTAAWFGFTAGLLLDVAVPEAMGARALSLTVAAYGVARIAGEVDGRRVAVHVLVLTAMGVADAFVFRIVRHLGEPLVGLSGLGRDLASLVPTALVAVLVLLVVRYRRIPRADAMHRRGAT